MTFCKMVNKQALILFGPVEIFFLIALQKYEKQYAIISVSEIFAYKPMIEFENSAEK